ncbi:hypothetical protein TEA_005792 [Camellia sinensis var. sinensis]|uniref:Uncharacterized protein n=1 Tax=Camellia sinensis var. sinensis TaxID=542762 RepID=A0A4S4EGS2_CAMSN|nr:hypothetical protein TEA_005792 [Camellia sinensis var. sinensis]
MTSLQTHPSYLQFCHCSTSAPKIPYLLNPNSILLSQNLLFSGKTRVLSSSFEGKDELCYVCCFCKTNSEVENVSLQIQEEIVIETETETEIGRPPLNINLTIILAEGVRAGVKTASIACVGSDVPTYTFNVGIWRS